MYKILFAFSTSLYYIVNIIAPDEMAMQGARASARLVLTCFSWYISVSAPQGSTTYMYYNIEAETKFPPFCRRHFQMYFHE